MSETLSQCTTWTGIHRGIHFEITQHSINKERPDGTWCYYLHIHEMQVPAEHWPDFALPPQAADWGDGVSYDYMSSPLADLPWHHGITFYEKRGGDDGKPVSVKAGCDFNHLWDQDYRYHLGAIIPECWETIDALLLRYPGIIPVMQAAQERAEKRIAQKATP